MRVKAHKLYDEHFDNWLSEIEDHWNFNDLIADTRLLKYYISFDGFLADPDSDLVFEWGQHRAYMPASKYGPVFGDTMAMLLGLKKGSP